MWIAEGWKDFELYDAASGEKLERWGDIILRRSDPQAVWTDKNSDLWNHSHATYHRSSKGGGHWEFKKKTPERWCLKYKNLIFNIKPMGFKHTGLFPEQASNWEWFSKLISESKRPISVLNLFAYTGGATVAALNAGASVVHVDAAKGMVAWAKENAVSSGLSDKPVRYIVDDVLKFVLREQRRNRKYDAIIMDPPSYGRGPSGEIWKIENELYPLVLECLKILSDNPLFFLINSYTTGFSSSVLSNILKLTVGKKYGGTVCSDELGLIMTSKNLPFPCGISGRWQA